MLHFVQNLFKVRENTRKAFSILELVTVLTLVAILSSVAVGTYRTVLSETDLTIVKNSLGSAQIESRRVLATSAINTNTIEFPENMYTLMSVPGLEFTENNSTSSTVVSVGVIDPTTLILAIKSGDDCWLTVDRLNGNTNWGISQNDPNCNAEGLGSVKDTITGNSVNPTIFSGNDSVVNPPNTTNAPGAPVNLNADAGNNAVSLQWEAPSVDGGAAVTDYAIEYRTAAGSWTLFTDGVSSITGGTVTGLTNGIAYEFRVAAVNTAGTGAESVSAFATPLSPSLNVEYLVVGGGGGGGSSYEGIGAGAGGGGGVLTSSILLTRDTTYPIAVGAGGTVSSRSRGGAGGNSVFSTNSALGGGGGGTWTLSNGLQAPSSGGSGGGGAGGCCSRSSSGAAGTLSQGYAGGNSSSSDVDANFQSGGGGGGAGGAGSNGTTSAGGNGGSGVLSNIATSGTYYAGGGGGGKRTSATGSAGVGGLGGGGNGGIGATPPSSGVPNTGGGGGGAGDASYADRAGGSGGSGVVILKYPASLTATFSGGVTQTAETSGGFKVSTVTGTLTNSETVTFS